MSTVHVSSSSRADFSHRATLSTTTTTKYNTLPTVVIDAIFQNLDYPELSSAMRVSREWRHLARGPHFWARLLCRHFCILPDRYLSQIRTLKQKKTRRIWQEVAHIRNALNRRKTNATVLERITTSPTLLQHYRRLGLLQERIEKVYRALREHPRRAFIDKLQLTSFTPLWKAKCLKHEVGCAPYSQYVPNLTQTPETITNSSKTITCVYTRLERECIVTAQSLFTELRIIRCNDSITNVYVDDNGVHILTRLGNIHYFDVKKHTFSLQYKNNPDYAEQELDPRGYCSLARSHNYYVSAKILKSVKTLLYVTLVNKEGQSKVYRYISGYPLPSGTQIVPCINKTKKGFSIRVQFVTTDSKERPDDWLLPFYFLRPRLFLQTIQDDPDVLENAVAWRCRKFALLEQYESDCFLATLATRYSKIETPDTESKISKHLNPIDQALVRRGTDLLVEYINFLKDDGDYYLDPPKLQNGDIQVAIQKLFTKTTAPFKVTLHTPALITKEEREAVASIPKKP